MTVNRASFSADGRWWWTGAQWVPAVSADGLWSWDGQEWIGRRSSPLPAALIVVGVLVLLLELPYALLTWIAVAGDPADIETSSDMAAFTRSRENWAHAYRIAAPTLAVIGLALIATGTVLLFRRRSAPR